MFYCAHFIIGYLTYIYIDIVVVYTILYYTYTVFAFVLISTHLATLGDTWGTISTGRPMDFGGN